MINIINRLLRLVGLRIIWLDSKLGKYQAEIKFWQVSLKECQQWYLGEKKIYWGEKAPSRKEKVKGEDLKASAINTWLRVHQQKKYLTDLKLKSYSFKNMKVLDIGSGPYPSASVFEKSDVYCLDPLLPEYIRAGYPLCGYEGVKFVYGYAEKMPFPDRYFDAIISVNALDHVDDFEKTAKEIKRVIKKNGRLRFHFHYHPKTVTEPLSLNDRVVGRAFNWAKGFRKIDESNKKSDYVLNDPKEKYVVWSNFK